MRLPSIKQSFSVNYSYQLHFTTGLFNSSNTLFFDIIQQIGNGRTKMIFVIDKSVVECNKSLIDDIEKYTAYFENTIDLKDVVILEGGEASKNSDAHVKTILKAINEKNICRHSFVIAIGGGALIDMVGYAATIAHRGVKLIRIPTTVLAQNDAAVGVKNSVNAFGKKNFIGTFAVPHAIINDIDFLDTLEQRDWIAGIAEALKVALIKDKEFFTFIEENAAKLSDRDKTVMARLIHRCAEIHMEHISGSGDPFETGSSRPLDFGHWAAHKLEQMTNYKLRHGEAVAIGIALDVTYSKLMGFIDGETLDKVLDVFEKIGFDLNIPIENANQIEELLKGIEEFREHLGGQLTITLISGIGEKFDVHEIDRKKMRRSIELRCDQDFKII